MENSIKFKYIVWYSYLIDFIKGYHCTLKWRRRRGDVYSRLLLVCVFFPLRLMSSFETTTSLIENIFCQVGILGKINVSQGPQREELSLNLLQSPLLTNNAHFSSLSNKRDKGEVLPFYSASSLNDNVPFLGYFRSFFVASHFLNNKLSLAVDGNY